MMTKTEAIAILDKMILDLKEIEACVETLDTLGEMETCSACEQLVFTNTLARQRSNELHKYKQQLEASPARCARISGWLSRSSITDDWTYCDDADEVVKPNRLERYTAGGEA